MKNKDLFIYALILTAFFLFLEISLFIQCNDQYLTHATAIYHRIVLPYTILPGIFFFLLAQLCLHLFFAFMVALLSSHLIHYLNIKNANRLKVLILVYCLWVCMVVLVNQLHFPNSNFANLSSFILNDQIANVLVSLLYALCFLSFLPTLIYLIDKILKLDKKYLLYLSLLIAFSVSYNNLPYYKQKNISPLPNIIIIGIDSLRPDMLGFFNHKSNTPFIDDFLKEATVFDNALTPIARTFPAWISILSGQHPMLSGVRTNLSRSNHFKNDDLLPNLLKQKGYTTVYASDEVRFSNIDKHYGFDETITPPIGINDFIIGTFNDFPLSNLVINTVVGKTIFPFSYANRAVYFTYEPQSFLNLLQGKLRKINKRPLFLAIHFCLPHYPYLIAAMPGKNLSIHERYIKSIEFTDKQIKNFFLMLEKMQILKTAMVVLLSDHGEALAYEGDRLTEFNKYVSNAKISSPLSTTNMIKGKINQSVGHGTDVLSFSQYHSLLAFRNYAYHPNTKKIISDYVSLLDVKPTILDYLNIINKAFSLKEMIEGKKTSVPLRHFIIESDFSPESLKTVYPELDKVLMESIDLFEVNPKSTRLVIKKNMLDKILKTKQYADYYGEWVLAFYPQQKKLYRLILVNLITREWTDDFNQPFAMNAPVQVMINKIKATYDI